MKKKIYILGLVLVFSFTGLQAQTIIAQGTCGTNLTWVLTNDSTLTINGSGAMDDYYPYNYGGDYKATPWDTCQAMLTTIIFGDSVASIGDFAFFHCVNLTSVSFPDSLITIGVSAFASCSTLTSVILPNSLITIGGGVSGCERLTSIMIPNSVTAIGSSAFSGCSRLTSLTISNSVTVIENFVFRYCSQLTSITIPNSVTTIGDYAFADCYRLTSATISNSVTTIGGHAFASCDQLTSITIPNSVTTIGNYAFLYCRSLNVIICKAISPPAISGNTFEDVPDTISIFVPCTSIYNYKTANYWNVFPSFRGIPDTTFISDTVCYGMAYTGNGFTVEDGAGIYYRTDTTVKNCDRVICLTLSEYDAVPLTQYSASICQGDAYNDNNFTNLIQTGDYYDTLQNINGCDSIIELTLTVNPIYFVSDTVMINQGETYNFLGKLLTEQGIYYDTLQTIYGCDSIFELNLTYKTSIVETGEMGKVKVFPNPTAGELRIENGELKIDNIEIYDILGKKRQSPFEGGRGMSLIDISHLPAGIYFIKIQTGKGIVMKKIIKE